MKAGKDLPLIDGHARPRRKADYRLEPLDDELLLYHPTETKILYCNASASVVWGLCDGQRTVQEIVDLLLAAFPEAAAAIPGDVQQALRAFLNHGALTLD